ncbi:hypothetical protein IQ273_20780 [Nodosilinea sp. LEGE 07298]|uniref:hypothetical protein n=1 Tax=Nodosilinea sp. LEGE 07298 TaxID=2777970 RepID=UPI0018819F81|nr:hypothetical protein [Nodosilinea sp. LEGE 07298]MBE9111846.1 hypothetical protein [Nodosilinea sp. LEGE 07298]
MTRLLGFHKIVASAGALVTLGLGAVPAIAQPESYCDDPGAVEAADTTRDLELEQFGVELAIPSNFRAMLLNNGTVKIVDPGTYELLVCVARGGKALGRGYAQTRVRTVENPDSLDLRQLVEQTIRENQEISPYTFDGQQGYLATRESSDQPVGIPDSYAALWIDTDDAPGAVVISTSCDCSGQRDRLLSLLERSKRLDSS